MLLKDIRRTTRGLLEQLDFFKQPIPTLYLKGKVKASSLYGSIISIMMLIVFVVYADFKLTILINR